MDTEPEPSLRELQAENQRLRRAVEELSVLTSIGSAIGATIDLGQVIELIVQESVRYLKAEQAAVMLLDDEIAGDPFKTMVRKTHSETDVVPFRFGQQLTGWMLKHRKPLVINDLKNDERFKLIARDLPMRSVLSVPLRAKGEMVGLLNVFNKRGDDGFTVEDQRLLSIIGSQSAPIVENARLYEELRRRTLALEDSETRFRSLMQEAGEAIFLADVDLRIRDLNQQAERLTGSERLVLLGRPLLEVLPLPDLADEKFVAQLRSGDSVRLSFAFERRGQAPFYYDATATLVAYADKQLVQLICLDVTEREKLESHLRHHAEELEIKVAERTREVRESQAQLVQQEKMASLGALVAGIAHEMNTPIGTINSNADTLSRSLVRLRELVNDEDCPASVREDKKLGKILGLLEEIARINTLACERIMTIVGTLRNFARLDEAELQIADLHEGLESTLTLVRHELKNRIAVERQFGEIPKLRCHPNQINQVFMNLLVNAAHAIEGQGAITIRTEAAGDTVRIHVSDSGVGIARKNLEKIFDPGFTTKGVGVGTGLGLSICYKIAQDHGGSISVQSELGKGTTFTLALPIR